MLTVKGTHLSGGVGGEGELGNGHWCATQDLGTEGKNEDSGRWENTDAPMVSMRKQKLSFASFAHLCISCRL